MILGYALSDDEVGSEKLLGELRAWFVVGMEYSRMD